MTTYRYEVGGRVVSEEIFNQEKKRIRKIANAGNVIERNAQCRIALHDVMAAHDERYKKWYKEPPPSVIEDYRCEEAKKTWPGYTRVLTPQGWKEGPPRFKTYAEQALYERTYDFRQETGERSHAAREAQQKQRRNQ